MPVQLNLGIRPSDHCHFDNFFVSERNRASVDKLSDIADTASHQQELILLSGVAGSGVSHLLQAACHSAIQNQSNCIYIPLSMFLGSEAEVLQSLLESIEQLDLLIIDDLQQVETAGAAQEVLFHLYNRILNSQVSLICGAACLPADLNIELADLKSRLSSMLVCPLLQLNDEEKKAALEERAKIRGFLLPDSVSNYLLKYGARNMQDLMGYLERVDELSLANKQKITIPLIKRVLEEAVEESSSG